MPEIIFFQNVFYDFFAIPLENWYFFRLQPQMAIVFNSKFFPPCIYITVKVLKCHPNTDKIASKRSESEAIEFNIQAI